MKSNILNNQSIFNVKRILTRIQNLTLSSNQLILLVCSYITFVFNAPFLMRAGTAITNLDDYSVIFLLSLPILLLSLTIILQSLVSFKGTTKLFLIVIVICSSIMFYANVTYGIVCDYGMIQNTAETDNAEALSYLNFYSVMFFLLFGALPALLIYKVKLRSQSIAKAVKNRLILVGCSFVVIFLIVSTFSSNYASVGRNNKDLINYITPYKGIVSSYKYVRDHYFYAPLAFKVLDTSPEIIRSTDRAHVTVMVVGETARAHNFSLNGYSKPTNQYTEQQGVISFTNMSSCGTATAVSVPCMFSRLNQNNYNKREATAQQNIIDVIRLAGADVLWISNNNGSCKGVCARVETEQVNTDSSNPLCDGEYCYDEALLTPLRKKLNNLTKENTLIVLHLIGSHGPTYFKRYPESKRLFAPDCQRSDMQHCTQEQLINSYDNTIAYTDFVLSEIINELELLSEKDNIDTSLLYVSDHGESLGENGVYLHGLPYAFAPSEQTHIPMLFWTDSKQQDFDLQCIQKMSDKKISHDNIFDTLLNIMSVRSKTYNMTSDAFIDCKAKMVIASTVMQPKTEKVIR